MNLFALHLLRPRSGRQIGLTALLIALATPAACAHAPGSKTTGTPPVGQPLPARIEAESPCVQGDPPIYNVEVPPDAPVLGEREKALVTIVEFAEFQCPYCIRAASTLKELLVRYPGQLRIVFRHNPLAFHKDALPAAKAALAAGWQDHFWEMHDLLFANPTVLDEDHLFGYAAQLGLDLRRFEADFRSAKLEERIQQDLAEAERLLARGVPTFFINGREFRGAQPVDRFAALIDELLPQAQAAGGTGDALYRRLVGCGYTRPPVEGPLPRPSPLREDLEKVYPVKIGNAPWIGTQAAPVEIIEYSDFQCPFCARAAKTLSELLKAYPGKVRIVYKHLPLPFHQNARLAAEASLAAGVQGKFWEMHDRIFANQQSLARGDLERYAAELGLDLSRFLSDLDSGAHRSSVEQDATEAEELGVRGTPTFFVNGRKLVGAQPLDVFQKAIDRALGEPR